MTTHERQHPDDLEWIHADDLLLDALGRGEAAPDDDTVAVMLAAWRADLADELPPVRAAVPEPEFATGRASTDAAPTVVMPAIEPRRTHRGTRRRPSGVRHRPRIAAVAASAVLLATVGGLGVASLGATPGSPLWPISQILNPARADVLRAQAAIDQARTALDQQRYADAGAQIDAAQPLVNRVQDGTDRQRLQTELDALRQQLIARTSSGVLGPAKPGTGGRTLEPGHAPGPAASGTHGGGTTPTPSPAPSGETSPSPAPGLVVPLPGISIIIHIG